jgi:transglutaminase-like putative cysteine protease
VEVASTGRLSAPLRLALVAEILSAYVEARRRMRREELPAAVAALRAPAHRRRRLGDDPLRLGRAVRRTLLALPTDSRCLVQALVLTRLLASRGVQSRLVLGASVADGFEAHAWVEHDGRPLLSPGGFEFERLVEL